MLLKSTFKFHHTIPLWKPPTRLSHTTQNCLYITLISTYLTLHSLFHTTLGTLFISGIIDPGNDTASYANLDDFFSNYAFGSHKFVLETIANTDEASFIVGVLTFVMSNYSVVIWILAGRCLRIANLYEILSTALYEYHFNIRIVNFGNYSHVSRVYETISCNAYY